MSGVAGRRRGAVWLSAVLVVTAVGACSRPSSNNTSSPTTTAPGSGSTAPGTAPSTPGTSAPTVAAAVEPAGKTIEGTIRTPDGRERTFRLYAPSTLGPGERAPLLIAMHGGVGSGVQFQANSGFDGLAEANRFFVVFPDGIGAAGTDQVRTWNGGYCCGPSAKNEVDDVTFISMLIDKLEAELTIDPARVFAAGHSNGGIMAYRLACELSEKIVAVGLQASSLGIDRCEPTKPVSLLHIHGLADQNHPVEGGEGTQGISGVAFRPARDGVTTLARVDACPGSSTTAALPANADVTVESWQPCRDGTEVQFVTVAGASHAWMGHPTAAPRLVGEAYQKYDSSLAVWTFLAAHPRR